MEGRPRAADRIRTHLVDMIEFQVASLHSEIVDVPSERGVVLTPDSCRKPLLIRCEFSTLTRTVRGSPSVSRETFHYDFDVSLTPVTGPPLNVSTTSC